MADVTRIISIAFSIFFNFLLFAFILKLISEFKLERKALRKNEGNESPWAIEVINPGANSMLKKGEVYSLDEGLSLGRKEDNDLILDDPYTSFHHLRFFIYKGRYVIEDLASTNGTRLNNENLKVKTYLKLDDIVEVGSAVFRIVH